MPPRRTEDFDKERFWKVKEGDVKEISSLEDRHLSNIVAYCRRKHIPLAHYFPIVREIKMRCFLNGNPVPLEIENLMDSDEARNLANHVTA